MLKFVRELNLKGPEEEALVNGYLRTGRDDLKASEILYREGLTALATYHLQQAVEKASKSYWLQTGVFNKDEVWGFGHNSLKGNLELLKKFSWAIPAFGRMNPKLNVDLSTVEGIEKKGLEFARYDVASIDSLMSAYDATDKVDGATLLSQSVAWMQSMVAGTPEEKSEPNQVMEGQEDRIQRIVKIAPLFRFIPFLFVASVVTFPHEEFTRYPDGEIKPWEYDTSMGIVARLPALIMRVNKVLDSLEATVNH